MYGVVAWYVSVEFCHIHLIAPHQYLRQELNCTSTDEISFKSKCSIISLFLDSSIDFVLGPSFALLFRVASPLVNLVFTCFVEVERVVFINYSSKTGKLATIIYDIVNQNKFLIDGQSISQESQGKLSHTNVLHLPTLLNRSDAMPDGRHWTKHGLVRVLWKSGKLPCGQRSHQLRRRGRRFRILKYVRLWWRRK